MSVKIWFGSHRVGFSTGEPVPEIIGQHCVLGSGIGHRAVAVLVSYMVRCMASQCWRTGHSSDWDLKDRSHCRATSSFGEQMQWGSTVSWNQRWCILWEIWSKGCKQSTMTGLAGVLLLSFSPWGKIPLRSLLMPSCSSLRDDVSCTFLCSHPWFLSSTVFYSIYFIVQSFPWTVFFGLFIILSWGRQSLEPLNYPSCWHHLFNYWQFNDSMSQCWSFYIIYIWYSLDFFCVDVSFLQLGKFSGIIALNKLSVPFFFSPLWLL